MLLNNMYIHTYFFSRNVHTMNYIPDGPVSFKCQGNRKEYCDAKHYIVEGIGDISDSICKKVIGTHFPSHGLPKAQQDVQGVKQGQGCQNDEKHSMKLSTEKQNKNV